MVSWVTVVQLVNLGCLDPRAHLEKLAKLEVMAKMELRAGQDNVDLEVEMEIQAHLVGRGYLGFLEKEDRKEKRELRGILACLVMMVSLVPRERTEDLDHLECQVHVEQKGTMV